VRFSRLRSGEWLALVGAVLLAFLLGTDWFLLSAPEAAIGAHESGIRSLGWLASLILVVAIALALAVTWATVTERGPSTPVALGVLSTLFSMLAVVAILVRLVLQPGLGLGAGNEDVDVALPAWLGLVAALLLAVGAWRAMGDERTGTGDAREQTERVLAARGEAKPAPPAQAPTMGDVT
jgi:hypothetical protein